MYDANAYFKCYSIYQLLVAVYYYDHVSFIKFQYSKNSNWQGITFNVFYYSFIINVIRTNKKYWFLWQL